MTLPSTGGGSSTTNTSHRSSRTSMLVGGGNLQYPSTLSSPNSDSAVSSALHTPAPVFPPPGGLVGVASGGGGVFSYKNYSPTASVDGESLFGHTAGLTQSAVHATASARFDESLSSATLQMDPLSQSMRVEPTTPRVGVVLSPTKSLRNRLGRFLGLFRREGEGGRGGEEAATASEDYIELFVSDATVQKKRGGASPTGPPSGVTTSREGEEPQGVEIGRKSSSHAANLVSSGEGSGRSDSPVNSHRQSGLEGVGQLAALDDSMGVAGEIDISTLPPISNRPSSQASSSDASGRASMEDLSLRAPNDSPNTAGAGHFDHLDTATAHSYKELGASATHISSSCPSSGGGVVMPGVMSSGRGQADRGGQRGRRHTEAELGVHAYQLQEKLQRLVEDKEPGNHSSSTSSSPPSSTPSSPSGGGGSGILDSHTPVMETSDHHQSDSRLLPHPPPPPPPPPLGHAHPGTALAMRRLSVCSRKGIGLRLTSESSVGGASTTITTQCGSSSNGVGGGLNEPLSSLLTGQPSPLALLDQFVRCGEVLHRGNLDTIPLTEQEGVDWNHFGGCPHSEEFRIMQSQMVLLHSQLLFERYQCVQHAKRNRRLLSKARSAAHVTEELVSLVSVCVGVVQSGPL